MRLATIRTAAGTRAARVIGDDYVELGMADVGTLLARPDWRAAAASPRGPVVPAAEVGLAPVVPRPGKIVCVGLNYWAHILEMGRDLPQFPALFAKYPEALTGPCDLITLPAESQAPDWEAELAVVMGATVRHADAGQAAAAIAGFSVLNDVTMRDWQYRTSQWLQGKTFEATTPFGPVLVTPDDLPGGVAPALALTCQVDGEIVQKADTGDLVFSPAELVRYVSAIPDPAPGRCDRHRHPGRRRSCPRSPPVSHRCQPAGNRDQPHRAAEQRGQRIVTARLWTEQGTARFLAAVARLADDELDKPIALSGWNRRAAG